jgi:hypothetical protein
MLWVVRMHVRSQFSTVAAILAVLTPPGVPATAVAPGAVQKPQQTSRAEAPLVTVAFRALIGEGKPFLDVRIEDVALKVNGRDRVLHSLVLVQPGTGPAAPAQADVPPPFATNARAAATRDTILVVDDESIRPGAEAPVRDAARQFLGHLSARDRVGIVTIPRGGLNLSLTADHAAIQSALAGMTGRAQRAESEADAACRTRQILDALMNVYRGVSNDSPATIAFFSGGLTPPMFDGVERMSTPVGLCDIRAKDYREVELTMLASPAAVYVMLVPDPTGAAGAGVGGTSSQTAGLEHLAGTTGNRMLRLAGNTENAMARLASETSAYYRATFAPEESERTGLTYRVNLHVKRPDIEVVAPPIVLIPNADGSRGGAKPASARDMLRVSQVYRDLPLRAAAFASRDESADKVKLVLLVEPADPRVSLKSAAVGLFDEKGRLSVQATADAASLARTPPMMATVSKPGTYRVRVAATDAAGRGGTVDTDMDVALVSAGPLKLSSLVLGVAEEGRFAGRLQFDTEPTAVAYLEIYGVVTGALSADLELADTENGPASVRGAMRITGEASDDRHVALGGIPIGSLPPGDIVVRAVVSIDGKPIGRVTRTLRKAGE